MQDKTQGDKEVIIKEILKREAKDKRKIDIATPTPVHGPLNLVVGSRQRRQAKPT